VIGENSNHVDIVQSTLQVDEIPAKEKKVIPQLTPDKAKAFEIFKGGYPSGNWIDNQKGILKEKYLQAKNLGETANNLRIRIRIND
jgi:kinesin family protein 6/9